MTKMSEELKNKYQNLINYSNANTMFMSLDNLLKVNSREFVLQREHKTEEEAVKSYVLRSSAMRFASDAIEHYAKAIIIQNGGTWDESKSWGHNLLDLFNNLDEESRSIIIVATMPPNELKDLENTNIITDRERAIKYLYRIFEEYNIIETGKYEKDIMNNDNIMSNTIDYPADKYTNYIDKTEKPITIFPDENIKSLSKDQTIEGELTKLNPPRVPGEPRQQVFGIKSRFPGQYLVDGNAEFLISMAYAFNKLSIFYRRRDESNRHL